MAKGFKQKSNQAAPACGAGRDEAMVGASGQKLRFDGWCWQFEFKPQDLWVGAFWKRIGNAWDLWICLIPCVPLHISWWFRDMDQ